MTAFFYAAAPAHAYLAPHPCTGPNPPVPYDATRITGTDLSPTTPKINQFYCDLSVQLQSGQSQYWCGETSSNVLQCGYSANSGITIDFSIDYYTCSWYGTSAHIGGMYFPGDIFDHCVHSLVPPTVSITAAPPTISQSSSSTLTWSSSGATSCTASGGGWSSTALSGSQSVTPPITTIYTLSCTGAGGTTSASTTVTVTPPPDITPPTVPTGLTASPISSSQINLTWNPSTDPSPNPSGVAGYKIERCTGATCTNFAPVGPSAITSYSDTGLAPATTYRYQVRAYDNANNTSGPSTPPASATTGTPPDLISPSFPTLTPLSGVAVSSTQIDLSWIAATDNVGVVAYDVYRGGVVIVTLGNAILTYSDVGLTPSTTYNYYIVARDAAGNKAQSNTVSVKTQPPPDITPPIFTFTSPAMTLPSGTTSALLAGTTKDGLTLISENATCRYNLGTDIAFASMTLFSSDTTGVINHSTPISGLTDGTSYVYYVRCRDTVGNTNTAGFSYMFQVAAPVSMPPVITAVTPTSGTIFSAGTTSATLSVTTDINAYCKYNQGSDAPFSAMSGSLSGNATAHTATLPGLTNGTSYTYFVRCQSNPGGMETPNGYAVAFSVANPVNVNPVALIVATPTSGPAPLVVSANGTGSYDPDGSIVQYMWTWGDASPDTMGVATASHTYASAGTYTITLRVIDNQGGSGTATKQITVSAGAPPPPPPPPASSFCVAQCTTDANCAPNVCGPSGVCIAPGSIGGGPVRLNGYLTLPSGQMSQPTPAVFPSNTTSVIMSLETDVNAQCQYTTFINTPYGASAMQTFSSTGTTKHAVTLTGITSSFTTTSTTTPKTYNYYVRCKNTQTGDVNTSDYPISFTISGATVISPWPKPYTCLINKNFVKNSIPYVFDVCIPK